MPTQKLYYADPDLRECNATIVGVEGNAIVCDSTIFFPEGGGQVPDVGTINGLNVVDVQKRGGRPIMRRDLPVVNVETEVLHTFENGDDVHFEVGQPVHQRIDASHRQKCKEHHSATHLAMGAIWERYGPDAFITQGCRITPTGARLDLFTSIRFSPELLAGLEATVNQWVSTNAPVEMIPVDGVPEVYIWNCGLNSFLRQPCGGTHVNQLGQIGTIHLKRTNKGKSLERLIISCTGAGA
jgi:alanyl-tRNA synthetase